ncbi:MAG: YbaB/EbfC family nucleoid-associated protein [Bacteroidetes bacterium]|nr:YbaB/EbfC family nucleoid-associated protein [Bacteroidota bacterium]
MFGKIAEAKQKAEEIKIKLSQITVEGKVQGITVVANGNKKIISVDIQANLLKPENKEQIEEILQLAIESALEQADNIAKSEMKSLMGSMLPGGLGNLFG